MQTSETALNNQNLEGNPADSYQLWPADLPTGDAVSKSS